MVALQRFRTGKRPEGNVSPEESLPSILVCVAGCQHFGENIHPYCHRHWSAGTNTKNTKPLLRRFVVRPRCGSRLTSLTVSQKKVVIASTIFLMSRRFHPGFGLVGRPVTRFQCRAGWEWYVSPREAPKLQPSHSDNARARYLSGIFLTSVYIGFTRAFGRRFGHMVMVLSFFSRSGRSRIRIDGGCRQR